MFDPTKVRSDFCVAYAALRSNTSPFGAEYVRTCNPEFLDRVVGGIVALRFGRAKDDSDVKEGNSRLKELLPNSLHDLVKQKYEQKGWADPAKFR